MNRALPLLLLIAAIAGGLGYMALRPADSGQNSTANTTRNASDGESPPAASTDDEIAPLAPLGTTDREETALVWDIIPMTDRGQVVPDAHITATHAGRERAGTGRTKWADAAAGTWDLVIESDDNPTWRRTVTVTAGKRVRTVARLGESLRIDGTVIDSFGEPVAETTVFFLPRGTLHPTGTNSKRTSSLPASQAQQVPGYISATTSASGKFRVDVPRAGAWRMSVGAPGAARWTQSKTSDLSHGGPDKVIATIPAMAHVIFESQGPEDDRPTLVRAYRFDERFAQKAADKKLDKPVKKPSAQKGKPGQETGGEESEEGDTYASSSGRTAGQLFDPGWILYRTQRVDGDGGAVLHDMPSSQEYRFLFMRQAERMVTAGAYRFQANKRSIVRVSLPPEGSVPAGTVDERASLKVSFDDTEAKKPGVSWSN